MNNRSIYNEDRGTHLKAVCVALCAAIALAAVGIVLH